LKKEPKTLAGFSPALNQPIAFINRSFLVLFFKKEPLALLPWRGHTPKHCRYDGTMGANTG
jgi:hypothetical protein